MEINRLIVILVMFATTVAGVFLFVLPKYEELKKIDYELLQKQGEYNSESVYYAKIAQVAADIEARKDALAKVDSALPSNFYFAPLVSFFQKKGDENGVVVKAVLFAPVPPVTEDKEVRNVHFSVNVVGNYQGFKNFLAALDSSARLFQINTISFASTDVSGGSQDTKQPKIQDQKTYSFQLEMETNTY
jgi:Tfp pilus assembly protein PilO